MNGLVSVTIPSRNEIYLQKTILDLLAKATGQIEIIVVLDGYWPEPEELVNDKRVIYIHFSEPRGMRGAINAGVSISHGEFIMKLDAHCMVGEGFDEALKANCEYDWVTFPQRFALDAEKWEIEKRTDDKYPVSYYFLSTDLHAIPWKKKNRDKSLEEKKIDQVCSSQGSCWFMKKSYFNYLELEDESNYGRFASEFQEIGLKCWLSGGKVMVNKNCWYAHLHKTGGRGYSLGVNDFEIAEKYVKRWMTEKVWHKQRKPFSYMIEKFMPMPGWPGNWKETLNIK